MLDGLPPPPMTDDFGFVDDHRPSSPPLPPPPMEDSIIPEMPQYGTYLGRRSDADSLPDWVPRNYLEKGRLFLCGNKPHSNALHCWLRIERLE